MAAAELYYTHNESGHAGVQTRASLCLHIRHRLELPASGSLSGGRGLESGRSGARDEDDPAAEAGPDHDRRGGPCAGRKSRAERMVTLVSARLVEEMLKAGEIMGAVRSECRRVHCSIVFRFGFSDLIQVWQNSNDSWDDDVA